MRVIRILMEMSGRNLVADAVVHPDEQFLAESVSRDEFQRASDCRAVLRAWPEGMSVERLVDDRFAGGSVLVVGQEGVHWVPVN